MNLPIINHDDYVAKINDDNKFPIKKFGALAKHLLEKGVVKKFYIPKKCSFEISDSIIMAVLYGLDPSLDWYGFDWLDYSK